MSKVKSLEFRNGISKEKKSIESKTFDNRQEKKRHTVRRGVERRIVIQLCAMF